MIEWWGNEPMDVDPCVAELCNPNSQIDLMIEAIDDPAKRADYIAKIGAAVETGWWNDQLALIEYVELQANDEVFETAQRQWEERRLHVTVLFRLRGRPIREDPRFLELMRTIGLFDFWKAHGPPDFCQAVGDSFVCN